MTSSTSGDKPSPSAPSSSWLAQHWTVLLCAAAGIAIFLALFIFVSSNNIPVGAAPATAGAMLAIITATAVGIERTIDAFWSLVGQLANGWWPFNKLLTEVTALEQDVKNQLAAAQGELTQALAQAGERSMTRPRGWRRRRKRCKNCRAAWLSYRSWLLVTNASASLLPPSPKAWA